MFILFSSSVKFIYYNIRYFSEKLGLQNFKILDSGKIRIYDHAASTQQLTKILALNDVEVVSIGKKSETLEDYFLKLTGEVKYHA